jgi:hypothetical protein
MTSQETLVEGQPIAAPRAGQTFPEQRHGVIALSPKAVGDLRDYDFFIPSYQRGYRWEEDQVLALLNDLNEFEKRSNNDSKKFYCLQPLVVMKRGNEWEVVDGQQRLTTIFLILKQMSPTETPPIHIRYERRSKTEQGLATQLQSPVKECSPDGHFILKADEAIQKWLKNHPTKLASLTNFDGKGPCAKFIWYEINRDSHGGHGEAIRAYTRLNAGKIRLKDSELIRASLLQSDVLRESDRQRIAIEWDHIERRLQNPEFWSFLNKKGDVPDTRIGLLFYLLAENKDEDLNETGDRKIFDEFFDRLKNASNPAAERKKLWEEVDKLFGTMEVWFDEHCLFHLIGLLIELEQKQGQRRLISDFLKDSKKSRKVFILKLKRRIRDSVLPKVESTEGVKGYLEGIKHSDSSYQIRRVLLCLNIATLLADKTKTARFSFAAYKGGDDWDIEHIRATSSREQETVEDLREALTMLCNYLEDMKTASPNSVKPFSAELSSAQAEVKKESPDRDRLNTLYKAIRDKIEGEGQLEASNGIKNLTLLDCGTNRGYGNSPFAVKRWWVLGIDRQAKYLLPCTRNVFTKTYSIAPGSLLYWTPNDADDYLEAIDRVLTEFFKDTWETKP